MTPLSGSWPKQHSGISLHRPFANSLDFWIYIFEVEEETVFFKKVRVSLQKKIAEPATFPLVHIVTVESVES